MQRLEVSGAVRPIYGSNGVKRLMPKFIRHNAELVHNLPAQPIFILFKAVF